MRGKQWSRRDFVVTGGTATFGITFGVPHIKPHEHAWLRQFGNDSAATLRDPRVKALILQAVGIARESGAQYADVHATYDVIGGQQQLGREVRLGLGVRALVDGFWGWAATPWLTEIDVQDVARQAVLLAKSLAGDGMIRPIEWAPAPVVIDGDWSTPIKIDPFTIAPAQIHDAVYGLEAYVRDQGAVTRVDQAFGDDAIRVWWRKQDRVFASTEGSYCTQTHVWTGGHFGISYKGGVAVLPLFRVAEAGYEFFEKQPLHESVPQLMAEAEAEGAIPRKSWIDAGRYDVVFGTKAMAELIGKTFATTTELDRALMYEANSSGTSYLGPDPMQYLGTQIASPLLTLTANRSQPNQLATVPWDYEGVVPEDFVLIDNGVLVDYQTTREQAPWLKEWYAKGGRPVRSHGCANAPDALSLPMQHTPNLVMTPGQDSHTLDDLVVGIRTGLLIDSLVIDIDQQGLNGRGIVSPCYEVKGGKRVARVDPLPGTNIGLPVLLFRTPELWKGLHTIGGVESQQWYTGRSRKGEPLQQIELSIGTVPATVTQITIIDGTRKA